jgi:hypothetical protein
VTMIDTQRPETKVEVTSGAWTHTPLDFHTAVAVDHLLGRRLGEF